MHKNAIAKIYPHELPSLSSRDTKHGKQWIFKNKLSVKSQNERRSLPLRFLCFNVKMKCIASERRTKNLSIQNERYVSVIHVHNDAKCYVGRINSGIGFGIDIVISASYWKSTILPCFLSIEENISVMRYSQAHVILSWILLLMF